MKDFKIYFSVAVILLVVYLVAQFNKPAPVDWRSTLYYKDKIPFGTYVLYGQLNTIFPGAAVTNFNKTLAEVLPTEKSTPGNYIIIANSVDLNSYDFKAMVDFIKNGNSIFISAFEWGGKFADTLKLRTMIEYSKKSLSINFTNKKLKKSKDYVFGHDAGNEYFSRFDTAHAVVLGENALGKSNYLCFKYGKGALYLSANPLAFTNYSLLNPQGADYAAKALSYLPVKHNVYWDEMQNGEIPEDDSPLRVFFQHPSLQWAYYICLFSLFTFILFEVKRRQRIIPVIEPLKNSTLDFVNVVGQVYFEQRNNQNISHKKILYFLEHVRTRYYLKTNTLNEEFITAIVQKSGVDKAFVHNLVNHINYVAVQSRVTDQDLITLNQLIEEFYTQSE